MKRFLKKKIDRGCFEFKGIKKSERKISLKIFWKRSLRMLRKGSSWWRSSSKNVDSLEKFLKDSQKSLSRKWKDFSKKDIIESFERIYFSNNRTRFTKRKVSKYQIYREKKKKEISKIFPRNNLKTIRFNETDPHF